MKFFIVLLGVLMLPYCAAAQALPNVVRVCAEAGYVSFDMRIGVKQGSVSNSKFTPQASLKN